MESATIKTVAAFLNSEFGGTLVIGVADDQSRGARARLRDPPEGGQGRFGPNQLVEHAVGLAAAANVTTTIHQPDGHDVCRVHVEPSGHPVEAEVMVADRQGQYGKKRMFYVRINNGTRAIEDEGERERYIAHRWGQA